MSEISQFQINHKCSYSVAHRTLKAIDHITQTKEELLEILETENREELERIEHRRWNIFMITHGFKYEKAERKDMYAKTHPCISKWEVLKVEKPDTLEYDFTPYYILKADR